jgi:hypothetical protein
MFYELLGRIVWQGLKAYLQLRWGNRPKQVGVGLLVAGGIGAAYASQRKVAQS